MRDNDRSFGEFCVPVALSQLGAQKSCRFFSQLFLKLWLFSSFFKFLSILAQTRLVKLCKISFAILYSSSSSLRFLSLHPARPGDCKSLEKGLRDKPGEMLSEWLNSIQISFIIFDTTSEEATGSQYTEKLLSSVRCSWIYMIKFQIIIIKQFIFEQLW